MIGFTLAFFHVYCMTYYELHTHSLEYNFRKLERGIRVMKRTRHLASFDPTMFRLKIEQLRKVFQELGRLPNSLRWPV